MSGGTDSFLAAYLACKEWGATVYPLYLARGASAQTQEQQALKSVLRWLKQRFPGQVKPLKTVTATFPPKELKKKYPKTVLLSRGYVGREYYFASVATQYALTLPKGSIRFISTGSLDADLYTHNGRDYWDQANALLRMELGDSAIPVVHPLQAGTSVAPADKRKVISFARQGGIPLTFTRSCVAATKLPCGRCLECRQRLDAEGATPCAG